MFDYECPNCVLNSTDAKPATLCVKVCTDDALLHRVGLVQSKLILLALCPRGDYDQVRLVLYDCQTSESQTWIPP